MVLALFGPSREPAGCVVKVGAAELEITELYPFLTELTVECSRTDAWTATLHFETRRDEQGSWSVQDAGILAPWEPIKVEASFGLLTEEVFRGYIREVKAAYPEQAGAATVTVECQDASIALDREHVRKSWGEAEAPTTDALIFQEIVGKSGLLPDPESGQGLSALTLAQDGTDITFLRARAEANGYELLFVAGTVYFGPMRLAGEPQSTLMVYAGPATNTLTFNVNADGHQPEKVALDLAPTTGSTPEARTIEPALPLLGPEPASGGGPGLPDFAWRMRRQGGADEAEQTARAQAKADLLSMRVKADGELDGTLYGHVLLVGQTVAVDGVGERLSGIYYVDSVHHRFSTDGYRQSFKLLRNAYGDNVPASAAGALGGLSLSISF